MAVHGTGASSLVDRYAEVLQPSAADPEDVLAKPVHVHRLDAPVGGLLIVAKTTSALRKLGYTGHSTHSDDGVKAAGGLTDG